MKIRVYDIETLKGLFLYMDYNPENQQFTSFVLSKNTNQLDQLCKWLRENPPDFLVGYNNLSFDSQVIEFILRNNEKWFDKSNDWILNKIYKKSQDIIDDLNYNNFPPFREDQLSVKQIDLFKIHHFDNENRRTSLKWLEFMMDMENIEEMPYPHTQEDFTLEQENEIIEYCKNDILATYKFYLYTRGQVSHSFYEGKDKIQDRIDLISELDSKYPSHGFSINYSDSKIGDELNKLTYMKLTGIKDKNKLYDLKRSRKGTRKFKFGDAIPEYVTFKKLEFISFFERIKEQPVLLSSKGEKYDFTYRGTTYTIAQGGIHSTEKNRSITSNEECLIIDADVGSQYPNAIRKRALFPIHLGIEWNKVGIENIKTRFEYKEKSNTDKRFKGLSEMYKLALNAGYFGKTIDNTNWQYGPEVGLYCTIGNQFEILMLIEMLETEGIHCISANTDGIVCQIPKSKLDKYFEICKEWEKIVGNEDLGKLEYTKFDRFIQESVNHYWAVKDDGKVKVKGRFDIEVELNKNNTDKISRIERKALREYFINNIPVEETIKKEKNIFMFCIGVKSSKNYFYRLTKDNTSINLQKRVLRFYISTDGYNLLKVKYDDADTNGASIIRIAQGYNVTTCNRIEEASFDNINYQYYIDGCKKIIKAIEGDKKIDENQLTLF